ncbi:MAG: hypothetical protein GY714_23830 [Desulfobacterales bacterium]|nr:hypothetical protein [Desulfobacterales bacterium]
MGLYYSLEFITKSENILKLLKAFSERLIEKDRERFNNFDIYEPEYEEINTDKWGNKSIIKLGFKHTYNKEYDTKNYYCLSMLAEADEGIINNFPDYKESVENNKVSIGCAWTSLYVGESSVLLQVDAPTTSISLMFEESENIHKLCSGIAKEVGDTKVYLNKDEIYWQFFPENKGYINPDFDLSLDDSTFNVDAYVKKVEGLSDLNLC